MTDPVQTDPLQYAPALPRDRRWLVRQGQDFTLTLAPRPNWHTALHLLVHASVAVFLAACAVWPPGKSMLGGVVVESETDKFTRLLCGVFAALWFAGVLGAIRHFRTWTVIELHRGVLSCTTPGILRRSTSHYTLSDFHDAVIGRGEDAGIHVKLVPRDEAETPQTLLDGPAEAYYRRSDLEYVAGLLREAIAESPTGLTTASSDSPPSSAGRTGR